MPSQHLRPARIRIVQCLRSQNDLLSSGQWRMSQAAALHAFRLLRSTCSLQTHLIDEVDSWAISTCDRCIPLAMNVTTRWSTSTGWSRGSAATICPHPRVFRMVRSEGNVLRATPECRWITRAECVVSVQPEAFRTASGRAALVRRRRHPTRDFNCSGGVPCLPSCRHVA